MIYKIKGKEMDDYAQNIDNLMINQFESALIEIRKFVDETEWVGPARDAFAHKYETIVKELDKIPYAFSLFTNFLGCTIDDYGETIEDLDKRFKDLDKDIGVEEEYEE